MNKINWTEEIKNICNYSELDIDDQVIADIPNPINNIIEILKDESVIVFGYKYDEIIPYLRYAKDYFYLLSFICKEEGMRYFFLAQFLSYKNSIEGIEKNIILLKKELHRQQ